LAGLVALAGLIAAFISNMQLTRGSQLPAKVGSLFVIDGFGIFFMGLIFCGAFAVITLSLAYLAQHSEKTEEFFVLILLATLGGSVLVISRHFVSFFLGLETLSISLYTLIAYHYSQKQQVEAGLKYLILAAVSSAFLLFGMALLYAATGTMLFRDYFSNVLTVSSPFLLLAGVAVLITGIGFKLAVVPFHMWTADIYQGASAPLTAFIATVSKGAVFALLLRFFYIFNFQDYPTLFLIFTIIAIASMFTGNWLALLQTNVKRILAYSSIAHLGYLLVSFLAGGKLGVESAAFYLVAYFITTITAFAVVGICANGQKDAEEISDYTGLYWRRPFIATVFSVALFSLAGIPLTAGFLGKFYVVLAGVQSAKWLLVVILVVNSTIGLFYYLRLIVAMFSQREESAKIKEHRIAFGSSALVAVLTVLMVWFGVYPGDIFEIIRHSVHVMGH
jgi:NADH-quinone oxidoreductase subunit N